MIRNIACTVAFVLTYSFAMSQTADYKVIFDMASSDTAAQRTVIRQVRGISQSRPDAQLEVVVYGGALDMVTKGKSTTTDAIKELSDNKKASFKVCAETMKRLHVDKSQLVPGVDVVPDGIYEIISKQHDGWGYIKVVH